MQMKTTRDFGLPQQSGYHQDNKWQQMLAKMQGRRILYIASGDAMNAASMEIRIGELKKLEINYHVN